MLEIQASLRKVESLREQLHVVITGRALTDPEVLLMSQRLDQALNEYRQLCELAAGEHPQTACQSINRVIP